MATFGIARTTEMQDRANNIAYSIRELWLPSFDFKSRNDEIGRHSGLKIR